MSPGDCGYLKAGLSVEESRLPWSSLVSFCHAHGNKVTELWHINQNKRPVMMATAIPFIWTEKSSNLVDFCLPSLHFFLTWNNRGERKHITMASNENHQKQFLFLLSVLFALPERREGCWVITKPLFSGLEKAMPAMWAAVATWPFPKSQLSWLSLSTGHTFSVSLSCPGEKISWHLLSQTASL